MPTFPTLDSRTVFLTGAASGIGAATARQLIAAGANVALVDLRAPESLAAELGPRALAVAGDVTDLQDMEAAVAKTLDAFGGIDICFANAGIAAAQPTTIAQTSIEEFERIIDVDLMGVWRTVRACLPHVIASGGHVLVNASIYAFFNGVANAPYAMSKAGVESFGRALRAELAAARGARRHRRHRRRALPRVDLDADHRGLPPGGLTRQRAALDREPLPCHHELPRLLVNPQRSVRVVHGERHPRPATVHQARLGPGGGALRLVDHLPERADTTLRLGLRPCRARAARLSLLAQ